MFVRPSRIEGKIVCPATMKMLVNYLILVFATDVFLTVPNTIRLRRAENTVFVEVCKVPSLVQIILWE